MKRKTKDLNHLFKSHLQIKKYHKMREISLRLSCLSCLKFKIPCLLTLHLHHTKFGKNWPSSSWEIYVNRRHMTTDATT